MMATLQFTTRQADEAQANSGEPLLQASLPTAGSVGRALLHHHRRDSTTTAVTGAGKAHARVPAEAERGGTHFCSERGVAPSGGSSFTRHRLGTTSGKVGCA